MGGEQASKLPAVSRYRTSPPASKLGSSSAPAWCALGIGLLLTAVYTMYAVRQVRAEWAQEFARNGRKVASHLEKDFAGPLSALQALHSLHLAVPGVDRGAFSRFAKPLLAQHPSLAALEWLRVVEHADRDRFERELGQELGRPLEIREPSPSGRLMRSPDRNSYAPLTRMEPEIGPLLGLDGGFEPDRRATMARALERGSLAISPRLRLVEDPPEVFSIAVYDPMFRAEPLLPTLVERRSQLVGYAIALYRIAPLARAALTNAGLSDADLALFDVDSSLHQDQRMLFATRQAAVAPAPDRLVHREQFRFVDRHWALTVSNVQPPLPGRIAVSAAFGLVASLLLAGLVWAWTRAERWHREYDQLKGLGQYTLLREIGAGGMGRVYEARHTLLRRPAAIKLISAREASQSDLLRFDREAQATSQLTHPNTVVLFDYGRTEQGDYFYAMEYVPGVSFEQLVRQHGPQPAARVRHLLLQICGALAEAHDHGFVHRDIKPSNLMLTVCGGMHDFVKVLDFGLVKLTNTVDSGASRAELVAGTPSYMAPECFLGSAAICPQSDMYSIGCVAYFLLTGKELFAGREHAGLAVAHLTLPPPAPRDGNGQPIDSGFERVIMRCLAKNPDERFASMRLLAAALERVQVGSWSQAEAAASWHNLALAG